LKWRNIFYMISSISMVYQAVLSGTG